MWFITSAHRLIARAARFLDTVVPTNSPLAQLVEHIPYKDRVGGSSPSRTTIFKNQLFRSEIVLFDWPQMPLV